MNLLTGKFRIPVLTGAFLIFAFSISLWLSPKPSSLVDMRQAEDFPWAMLSTEKGKNLDAAFQTLVRLLPWGGENNEPKSRKQTWWQFRGVVQEADKHFALIETEDKKTGRYVQGDVLPGGEILKSVHKSHIEVQFEDNTYTYRLFTVGNEK